MTQIDKITDEYGFITANLSEIQEIITEYYEKIYASKLDNLKEMDKLWYTQTVPKLKQKDIENLNRPLISKEI